MAGSNHHLLLLEPSPCLRVYEAQVGHRDSILLGEQYGLYFFFFDLLFLALDQALVSST
jgi:hypothetical protein